MHLRPPSLPSTPSSYAPSSRSPSTALTTPSPSLPTRVLVPSGLGDVRIPIERIDPLLAARMVMITLESLLYIKGQVPMSVQQMRFLGDSGKNQRAVKKRLELVETLDVLSSHLTTTFIQLSTAIAKCKADPQEGQTGRAHLLITLGPPSGGSRERVLLELQGFEVKDWMKPFERHAEEDEDDEEELEDEEQDEDQRNLEKEDEQSATCSEQAASEGESSDSEERDIAPDREESPLPEPEALQSLSSSASSSRQSSVSPMNSPCRARVQAPPRISQRPPPDPARMLALALINLKGSQTAPTRIHLMLRAPRQFEHVSWEPRQNLSKALDGSCFGYGGAAGKAKKNDPERITVITTQPPSGPAPRPITPHSPTAGDAKDEQDQPIWFEWRGKIQGFMEI